MRRRNITKAEVEALIAKHGGNLSLASRKSGVPKSTLRDRLHGRANPRRTVGQADGSESVRVPEKTKVKGFVITADTRVRDKKPTTTLRAKFYELKRGTAYREVDLAREWGVSPETVRRYAKEAECFAYVETRDEYWEACAMHPETAAEQLGSK